MKEEKNNRNKWIHLRVTPTEYKKINTGFGQSTKRNISEYIRAILLEKPITVYTRNRSYDDFVTEMILLRNELKAIGNNFNQAVKKLHVMNQSAEIKSWAILNESSRELLVQKVAEINVKIAQISDKWLQE